MSLNFIGCLILFLTLKDIVMSGTATVSDDSDEEAAESNYAKSRTELQKAVLKNYDKRKRPVLDQYSAVFVSTYVYLTHVSVDQLEQTVTLAGIIIMKWIDEFAVWDPSKYFGIKKLTLSQWEVWTPEIRATNSVNGRGQFYEISRRSHVTLESINATRTIVIIRPKFNIKIACNFDYSSYPNDVQNCALGLFTIQRINEVHLVYAFEPYIRSRSQPMWYFQDQKRSVRFFISNWNLTDITYSRTYFLDGKEVSAVPETPDELDRTWSVLLVKMKLERYAPYFRTSILLPAIISFAVVIASYFLPSPVSAMYILLGNFFLIDFFLEDLLALLPPVVGGLPAIVRYVSLVIVLTTMSVFVHYWCYHMLMRDSNSTSKLKHIVKLKRYLPQRLQGEVVGDSLMNDISGFNAEAISWTAVVNTLRLLVSIALLVIFFISTTAVIV